MGASSIPVPGATLISPYMEYDHWYKGELHCHSESSCPFGAGNGMDPDEAKGSAVELETAYKKKVYDFVFVTDIVSKSFHRFIQ